MKAPLRVALLPMTSTDRVEVNVQNILSSLNKITLPVDIVFLPENSLYFNFNKKLDVTHVLTDSVGLEPLISWAKDNDTAIHFGGVPYKTTSGICNTSLFIDSKGNFRELYDKIHLFDVDVAGCTCSRHG